MAPPEMNWVATVVVLLAVHIGVNHFGNLDKPGVKERSRELIVFSDVAFRMGDVLWWVIDVALLGFVLGGSVAVEQAFGVPGLGRALVVGAGLPLRQPTDGLG